jgi:secreted Zn-dependent insulinase-like peptidase
MLSRKSQIIAPSIDTNNYKYLVLENKLKVLIIQDATSNSGTAALCVGAGSW